MAAVRVLVVWVVWVLAVTVALMRGLCSRRSWAVFRSCVAGTM
jgi:hypothetical protein